MFFKIKIIKLKIKNTKKKLPHLISQRANVLRCIQMKTRDMLLVICDP